MSIVNDLIAASEALPRSGRISDERYDQKLKDHVTRLRQLLSNNELDHVARDESLLDQFDPSKDSITYLFLLQLQIHILRETTSETFPADLLPLGKLWSRSTHYLEVFNPVQVRYAGHEWRQLIELVVQAAQAGSKPLLAAPLVKGAMLRLDPSCAVFTSTHLLLVQLCLAAKAYTCALPVLEKPIYHIPILPSRSPFRSLQSLCAEYESSVAFVNDTTGLSSTLNSRDYLQYLLYGGMIYMALKKWDEALNYLGTAISTPTKGPISMIVVEAYKKFILVGLLDKGKMCTLPNSTATQVVKTLQSLVKPYLDLAKAFEQGDRTRLEAEIDAAQGIWSADKNTGLVFQVVDAFYKHSLVKIKKVVASLSVAELTAPTSPFPGNLSGITESQIASLIMAGDLDATLVHSQLHSSSSILRFKAGTLPLLLRENGAHADFQTQGKMMEGLFGSMEQANHRLGLSEEFIDNTVNRQQWPAAGGMKSEMGGATGLEMEEDIMGDLS
ncbi:hypothetical protein N7528_005968 [Penicillium herquei]|nr:hypothetical protein N7528_005968 [Penicillium herquei]